MNDMHFHCQACKKAQWLSEDATHCSYCSSTRLWEIEEAAPQFKVPERITVRPVTMDENIGYRRDMIEAGRGRLLR